MFLPFTTLTLRLALWISCMLHQMVALTDCSAGWTNYFPLKIPSMTCSATFVPIQRRQVLQSSTLLFHHNHPSTQWKALIANPTSEGSAHMREVSWRCCTTMPRIGDEHEPTCRPYDISSH